MRTSAWIVASLLVAAIAGCGDDDGDAQTPQAQQPPGRAARFVATDGVELRGTLTPAGNGRAPAIVLVHQRGGSAEQWDPLIPDLHQAGFTTLAYDSRDAGELDERVLQRDVAGALTYLREQADVDAARLGVVGASIGAATAVLAIGTEQRRLLDAAVVMSPADSPLFIELATAGRFHPHDVLFVSDKRERVNSDNLLPDATRSRVYETAEPGHGVELLPNAAVRREIVEWLNGRVR